MPDEITPDAPSGEKQQPENGAAVSNGVADPVEPPPESEGESSHEDAGSENAVGNEEMSAAGEAKADADAGVAVAEQDEAESDAEEGFSPAVKDGDDSEENAEEAMLAMLEKEKSQDQVDDEGTSIAAADEFPDLSGIKMEQPVASPAEFQQLSPTPGSGVTSNNIDLLLDVRMPVSIELGRTEMPISELLSLGPGSVVELNKLAGEPVDLLVNDKIIAKGEVVVVDENFGVRITLLMSPQERLKSLAQE